MPPPAVVAAARPPPGRMTFMAMGSAVLISVGCFAAAIGVGEAAHKETDNTKKDELKRISYYLDAAAFILLLLAALWPGGRAPAAARCRLFWRARK